MVATVAAGTTAQYYLSLTDYYTGSGEPRGRWVKVGFDTGFVAGSPVENADFERLHAGLDRNGKFMLSNRGGRQERTGGVDVTFSAPKSASVLWALADHDLRAKIALAHEQAVGHALNVLEENAAFCRSGKNGVRREKVRLTVATFQHGDARPAEHSDGEVFADANLHTHAVVVNIGEKNGIESTFSSDNLQLSRIGALDGKAIYNFKMAAGAAYHLAFSTKLQELGLAVTGIGKNGIFEISGVDEKLRRYFSARRESIDEELEKLGLSSAQAPALAAEITRATRKAKRDLGDQDRFAKWKERAEHLGFSAPDVQHACLSDGNAALAKYSEAEREKLIAERMEAIPKALTEHDSAFERRNLYAAVATALVGTGAPADRVEQEIAKMFEANAIVALDRDVWGHEILSTPELLQIEREIGGMARRLNQTRGPAPEAASVERLIAESQLSDEQKEAVRAATRGDVITIIEGAPGSGKTTTLGPVKAAWEAAGYRVIGSATAWKIAHMLRDDLSIDARATDSWLAGAEHGQPFLDDKTVLILDEAGLLSSRQMHKILSAVDAAGSPGRTPRLVAVGDRNQLQPAGEGAGLRLLAAAIPVQAVEAIQRQREPWAREAILAFGKGEADKGLQAFAERGLVHQGQGSGATIRALVDAWEKAADGNPNGKSLMIAATNAEVRAISHEVRGRLRHAGRITGEDVTLKAVTPSGHGVALPLAAGDKIRFLTRARLAEREVINGTEATIVRVENDLETGLRFTARTGDERFTFQPNEIADAHGRARIAHAYATTTYGSQGLTSNTSFVLLSPDMDRHAIIVAASRARDNCEFFIDERAIDARLRADLPLSKKSAKKEFDEEARFAFLAKRLARSGLKQTTVDVLTQVQERGAPAETSTEMGAAKTSTVQSRGRWRDRGLALD